ncbi:MAG: hypothetical protein M3Y57_12975 [Acidobacteriota bacterium]|nr:hypothetical protein [Acidobacteriota bacterium]
MIFVCGLAFGIVATSSFFHTRIRTTLATPQLTLDQLRAELHLSPEQEKTIAKELDDYAKYYQNIEEEREDVANTGKQNILRVLSPEQKKRFLAIFNFSGPPVPNHAR